MGRPVKKSRFGNTAGDFEVTGAFSLNTTQPDGTGAETVSTASGNYIVSQRGSRQFLVNFLSTDASTRVEQTLTLTAKAPASLVAGEFCVQVILSDSTVAYVSKFFNKTVHYVTAAGATGSIPYTLGTEGNDQQASSGVGSIDTI
tara:strand:+ start:1345 stop:1779 length:435 start_codon:yes stop_codon:yes gene_type:complete